MDQLGSHVLGFGSEVGIEGSGFGGVVTEILLDEAEVDASLQQMGGIRLPERVNRGWLVDAGLAKSQAKGILNVAERCRPLSRRAMNATASGSGEPTRPMVFPVMPPWRAAHLARYAVQEVAGEGDDE
jgi:hypothetical protein